jgi:hypothetical protein
MSAEAEFFSNDEELFTTQLEGEPGLIEVEVTDNDEVAVHFRHVNDESPMISGYVTKARALGLAHALTVAALRETVGMVP